MTNQLEQQTKLDVARETLRRIASTTRDETSRELAEQTLHLLRDTGLVTERFLPSEGDAYRARRDALSIAADKIVLKGDPEPSYTYLGTASHIDRVYGIVKDSGFGTRKETIEKMSRGDGGANGNLIILEYPSIEQGKPNTYCVFHVIE